MGKKQLNSKIAKLINVEHFALFNKDWNMVVCNILIVLLLFI